METRYIVEGVILIALLFAGFCLRYYTRHFLENIESDIKIKEYKECKGRLVDLTEDEEEDVDWDMY